MLKIALLQIPEEGVALAYEKDPRIFDTLRDMIENGEVSFQGPLRFELMLRPERDIIRLDGKLEANLTLTCSRCLEAFDWRVRQSFTLRYARQRVRNARLERGAEIEMTSEQIGLSFFEGEEIDLRNDLQEQVVMALPVKPLCREDCKGLCPQCGTDLNRNTCRCRLKTGGGPFDQLKALKLPSK